MTNPLSLTHTHPEAYAAMSQLEDYCKSTSISALIRTLVKLRVSIINGCSLCIDMHTQEALKLGQSPERLALITAFMEVPHFTGAEKAALKMAEELAFLPEKGLSEATRQELAVQFTPQQIMELGLINVSINGWNRLVNLVGMHAALPQLA
ncbi:carboxymuconolactone decarboxylase family protein [Deinococcus roseus]|uniref:Carboxymuconolactone decarboxylase-like domain-containing protein n=1 Tax=Deinococcus roseus TaxID=392414 RepID=A0ABQ2CV55_9DEIO|nr:carboxymuconolactone decarboxylase family protein [Deinococcus roseus]GGJ23821.1 hypothetical protein GCM10008938_07520 [Deinococcus roseus]